MNIRTNLVCLFIFSITAGFFSCTKPDISFGENYLGNNYTNVVVVDTATAAISTVLIDSFGTSATGKAVFGTYNDPYFGNVSADSYFPLVPPAYNNVYENTTYDSVELIIKPNRSYYGDTTKPLLITVHQLQEPIKFAENRTELYNTTKFAVKEVLGTKTMVVRPSATDSISIKLLDFIGRDFYNKLKAQDPIVQSSEQFLNYFNGVRLSANGFMLGISDSVKIRLHYSKSGVVREAQKTDFTLSNNALQFNNININRANTALQTSFDSVREISSDSTNNTGFLQSSTGTVVKISFPYIRDFLKIDKFIKIIKADLTISPVNTSFNGMYPLPPFLRLSQTTQLNTFGNDITNNAASSPQVLYGDLQIDNLYNQNTNYRYDVTAYINTQINNAAINRNGLLLSPPNPSFNSDLNRVLIGNKMNANGKVKLRIYYVTVDLN